MSRSCRFSATPWYTSGRVGLSRLAYRNFVATGVGGEVPARMDTVDGYGLGIGRLLASDLRVGVEIDHVRRGSTVGSHAV